MDAPRRNPSNAFRPVGEEGGLVVDSDESKVHVLNPVGTLIYSLLDGDHSKEDIVRAVVERFDVDERQAAEDLEGFLADLESHRSLAPAVGGDAEEAPHE